MAAKVEPEIDGCAASAGVGVLGTSTALSRVRIGDDRRR
jgi:hypothetical protein